MSLFRTLKNGSCPLSAFPTFRISVEKLLDIVLTSIWYRKSGSGGGVLNRKRKGARP